SLCSPIDEDERKNILVTFFTPSPATHLHLLHSKTTPAAVHLQHCRRISQPRWVLLVVVVTISVSSDGFR
ncbi:hypothetical protein A2U01_0053903, partial [Trifolium medium]|nr:hypothetical protein [Trifolium medium]